MNKGGPDCEICGPTINGVRMCDACRKEEVFVKLRGRYIDGGQFLEALICDSCMDKIDGILGGPK